MYAHNLLITRLNPNARAGIEPRSTGPRPPTRCQCTNRAVHYRSRIKSKKTARSAVMHAKPTRRPKYLATHCSNYQVDLKNRRRSNLNLVIESPHATFYLLATTMFALSVTICFPYINSRIVQAINLDMQIGPRSNVNMLMKTPYATLYLLAIAMFAQSVIMCEKFAIEMCMTLTLTFRMGQLDIYRRQWKSHMRLFVLSIAMFVLSPFARY